MRWSRRRKVTVAVCGFLLLYLTAAYVVIPALWARHARRHPALDDMPAVARTGSGIPGDPINVALVGTRDEAVKIMLAAKWHRADPITLRSSLLIAAASMFSRPYDQAPVSHLYLWGRKEDLAFQRPVGKSPRQRHHVRFWQSEEVDEFGRPLWAGSVTFDTRVGLSHTTGQITHHIAADVDAERDQLFRDLQQTGDLFETYAVDGFHEKLSGRNGGGDPWHTDGDLHVGVIAPAHDPR